MQIAKIYEKFGKNLKEIRQKKNISLEQLAKLTNMRKEYLLKIENGLARKVALNKVGIIIEALDISLDDMFKGIE